MTIHRTRFGVPIRVSRTHRKKKKKNILWWLKTSTKNENVGIDQPNWELAKLVYSWTNYGLW